MTGKTVRTVRNGEWIAPRRRAFEMVCCDCSLTHRVDFRLRGGRVIEMRMFRDRRATANRRRAR